MLHNQVLLTRSGFVLTWRSLSTGSLTPVKKLLMGLESEFVNG